MQNFFRLSPAQFRGCLLGLKETASIEELGKTILCDVKEWQPEASKQFDAYVHQILYTINTTRMALPWKYPNLNINHPIVSSIKYHLESQWRRHYLQQLDDTKLPMDADAAINIISEYVQQHPSNVSHPIFDFLKDKANKIQLREFIRQETPFDIYFGDLINQMMLGIYGDFKEEMISNFWDEMGHGKHTDMHRTLRLNMMRAVNITEDDHLLHSDTYLVSELTLANMYFEAAFDRGQLVQLIGMMMATELMVPGRLEKQIAGWKRVDLSDKFLRYLIEHTTVDVKHAKGWIDRVVRPLLREYPAARQLLYLGVQRRMRYALAVCNEVFLHLQQEIKLLEPI